MMRANFYTHSNERAIPIHVIDELQYPTWLEQQSSAMQTWLTTNNFSPKAGSICLVPDANGKLAHIVLGLQHDNDVWALGKLPGLIPSGTYLVNSNHPITQNVTFYLAWGLQQYTFDNYKDHDCPAKILVFPKNCDINQFTATLNACFLVRDLINTPTQDMAPQHLATTLQDLAEQHAASFKQVIGDELLTAKFPAIHAVGRASINAPRLLEINWGEAHHPRVTLVGKGVCFDTGGLNIKCAANMRLMKKDMGGAANVMGLASLIMQTKLPIRLRVLIPAVENSISDNAYRPGDILNTHKGLTVEIDNTDAEGRVVLADALALACEDKPDLIIDMATLTGAAKVALGPDLPAMFTNDESLAVALRQHSLQQHDPVWHLPLFEAYLELIKPDTADLANCASTPYAGAIIAALFLQQFVEPQIPWVHLDIMAWNEKSRPGRPRGGETAALRAIYAFLQERYR